MSTRLDTVVDIAAAEATAAQADYLIADREIVDAFAERDDSPG